MPLNPLQINGLGAKGHVARFVGGRWLSTRDARFNLRAYGAVGDGSTADDQAWADTLGEALNTDPERGCIIEVPPGRYRLTAGLDLSAKRSLRFVGTAGRSYNESGGYGATIIADTASVTLFTAKGTAGNPIQTGPQFTFINFRANKTGVRLVHLELCNHWGFDRCAFVGFGDGTGEGIYIWSDATPFGATSGGDASWGYVNECVFRGSHVNLMARHSYGFTVKGGNFTQTNSGDTGMVLAGSQIRVQGVKADNGVCVDLVGQHNVIEVNCESASVGVPMVRLGETNGTASPLSFGSALTTTQNEVRASVVGRAGTETGIRLGQYATGNIVTYSATNLATQIDEHASAVGNVRLRRSGRWDIYRDIASDFAAVVRNTSSSTGGGLKVSTRDGSATGVALHIETRTDTPIDAVKVYNDGHGTIGGSLYSQAVTTKTADYTATLKDELIRGNNSAAAITITLPAASGNTGKELIVKRVNTQDVIVDGNASETIDGAATKTLTTQYAMVRLRCNGSGWDIVGQMGTVT